ncbi:HAD family hydrolase [Candidatus Pseudoscillospira sp. SGI.172]|uniref:HAD family hydrolase n=1 Tax=Candidatus Pseudoscillospira sp. SGI.172 TaxID=3420582 RepID=UPI003CFC555C
MTNLLFDYDGTIHDSLHIYVPAVQSAYDRLASLGYAAPRRWTGPQLQRWIGYPPLEMWNQFQPRLPENEKQFSAEFVGEEIYRLIENGQARLYPHITQVLETLHRRGYRLLLLSTCPRRYLDTHVEHFGLHRWFDAMYCGEAYSYRPKHEICRLLMEQYDGRFLAIGDRKGDIEIGRQNQFPAIGCCYGYGASEEFCGAARLVRTPAELADAVCSL